MSRLFLMLLVLFPVATAFAEQGAQPHALSQAKLWALALSAPLALENGELHTMLSGQPVTPSVRDLKRNTLAAGWGVYDRSDLLAQLDQLANHGHSAAFSELAKELSDPDLATAAYKRALHAFDAQALHRVELVKTYNETFAERALAAWDYSRYVSLARWGYASGYLNEQETWALILQAARHVQEQFSSWAEFAENYYAGFRFFSLRTWLEDNGLRYLYVQQLLHDEDSPWVRLPWDLDLSD